MVAGSDELVSMSEQSFRQTDVAMAQDGHERLWNYIWIVGTETSIQKLYEHTRSLDIWGRWLQDVRAPVRS
jgi:hypothetical protein